MWSARPPGLPNAMGLVFGMILFEIRISKYFFLEYKLLLLFAVEGHVFSGSEDALCKVGAVFGRCGFVVIAGFFIVEFGEDFFYLGFS